MRSITLTGAGLVLMALAVAPVARPLGAQTPAAPATPAAVHVMNGMLTDAKGMSLYTFDRDSVPNKSACTGQCLANWPVLKAADADSAVGDWTVYTHEDGTKAWAYKGKPLYYFAQDKAAGDKVGDGRGGVWHLAKP